MARGSQRWTEVTRSQFTHEAEGLNLVRSLLPSRDPFLAWSNFEFRDRHGRWHEVDLLVLGERRLHLVELKYYSGTLRGDDHIWLRDGRRPEDSPLKLARRKAQRLASKLQDELIIWANEKQARIPEARSAVPFVQEAVFLHHPDFRCALPASARLDLFGLNSALDRSGLPGISSRLLEPATFDQKVSGGRSAIIAELMARIGVVQRRQREAGSWIIDEEPLGEGEGWQDWPAFHKVATTDRARIRFLVTAPGAAAAERAAKRRLAEHEYRVTSRLAHNGLVGPIDLVDSDLGVGLVYRLDERFQRLDLWLADQSEKVSVDDQFSVIRQVAEAVSFAHGNRIVHRGLNPQAIWVRRAADGTVRVQVRDWQSAGSFAGSGLTGSSAGSMTGVASPMGQLSPGSTRAGLPRPVAADADQRLAEAFQAPEGIWSPDADRVRLDVFALGALAYFTLAARPAAADRTSLRERLRQSDGLDLAADLPQVAAAVRELVLEATRPKVSDRLGDVRAFLAKLSDAEKALGSADEDAAEPLEASPGSIIGGRYRLERRLGEGSTAVGLLVTDLSAGEGPDALRVLKVAIDDGAAARLVGEAEVLANVRDPRLVKMIEGPVRLAGRTVLVLEPAGDKTLAEELRYAGRLSLDLQERWGIDLLEALIALDRAGIDHRDIKPANLGVKEGRSDRAKHLVLFDFSLARTGATAVTAGTPPYLDPFLEEPSRGRFDSAAERYAAAVVLFEMATGSTPQYGDGLSDPASLPDEATIDAAMFDPAVAGPLAGFFRRALARSAAQRHETAAEMLQTWRSIFAPVPKTMPADADALAAQAQPSTPLAEAGLSDRGLSALRPFGVQTVGDLIAVDPVRLNHMRGVADSTRREVKSRANQWRHQFAAAVTGRGPAAAGKLAGRSMPDPVAAAELLAARAGSARAQARRKVARILLGLETQLEPFASQSELSAVLKVSPGRAAQQVGALQDAWAGDAECRILLDALGDLAAQALTDLGGVATVAELAETVLAALPPATAADEDESQQARIAAGLLRVALDRNQALGRADEDTTALSVRRRAGKVILLATDPALLDPAEAVGRMADQLIEAAEAAGEALVPPARAIPRLQAAWSRAADISELAGDVVPAGLRLLRLAAAMSEKAALSGSRELHSIGLSATTALGLALTGAASVQKLTQLEIRDRLRARFPSLPPAPDRPRLDQLISDTQLGLIYDETMRAYRQPSRSGEGTRFSSRLSIGSINLRPDLLYGSRAGHRLAESSSSRSFLALGIDWAELDRVTDTLLTVFGAIEVDVTSQLIAEMRSQAAEVGLPWETVRAADAAPAGGREALGLSVLVERSLPAIDAAIDEASAAAPEGTRPVLLTEVGPLARYGHLTMLADRADLATRRRQAIWLVVPQLPDNQGPVIDGRALPLAAPGQFYRLDLDSLRSESLSTTGGFS